ALLALASGCGSEASSQSSQTNDAREEYAPPMIGYYYDGANTTLRLWWTEQRFTLLIGGEKSCVGAIDSTQRRLVSESDAACNFASAVSRYTVTLAGGVEDTLELRAAGALDGSYWNDRFRIDVTNSDHLGLGFGLFLDRDHLVLLETKLNWADDMGGAWLP